MRNRKLGQEEAFEEYLVYQIRVLELLEIFQIEIDIIEGRYEPRMLGHGRDEFMTTIRTYWTGLFASLIDKNKDSLNVFDVWKELYPDRTEEIEAVWEKLKGVVEAIRAFRNNVAFHVNSSLKAYMRVRGDFYDNRKEVVAAVQEFLGLATLLMREQREIPDFEARVDRTLNACFPGENPEKIRRLKEYLILA